MCRRSRPLGRVCSELTYLPGGFNSNLWGWQAGHSFPSEGKPLQHRCETFICFLTCRAFLLSHMGSHAVSLPKSQRYFIARMRKKKPSTTVNLIITMRSCIFQYTVGRWKFWIFFNQTAYLSLVGIKNCFRIRFLNVKRNIFFWKSSRWNISQCKNFFYNYEKIIEIEELH